MYLRILALLAVVILHTLVPQLGLAGSVILTEALIVPWIVSACGRRNGDTAMFQEHRRWAS